MKLSNSLNKLISCIKSNPLIIVLAAVLGYFMFKKLGICGSVEGFESQPSKFESDVSNGKKLVWFYADWCGHCTDMKPEWDKASNNVNGKMVKVNLGDGEDGNVKKISEKYGIQGFPTILLLENGEKKQTYEGERNASDFESFVNDNTDSE